jgi:hypothetical protein
MIAPLSLSLTTYIKNEIIELYQIDCYYARPFYLFIQERMRQSFLIIFVFKNPQAGALEIAEVAVYLASNEANFVHGVTSR